ncbi:Spy/CpxP family protein refolding chaperone [Microvirga roseola]|uniref:Spy/CpxP family protein refolding chaperone n=1 Tax=Microvirga roseola TaxID=2883126 RepID=UPI001E6568B6|nr:Spy/CpxP family protein refolding chaperone [Microvirga roseola]
MKKITILATAALVAATSTFAIAQQQPAQGTPQAPAAGQQQEQTDRRGPRGLSQDDFSRLLDARVAAIKAGLKLTPEQENLWQPVEVAIRENANERFDRMQQFRANREQRQDLDFMQRLERRGTMMTENAQRASSLATALRPLWNTLSEDQKRIAPRLLQTAVGGMGWRERGGRRGGEHHGRRGGMHHGRGMMGQGGMGPGGMGPGGMGPGGPQAPAQQQ